MTTVVASVLHVRCPLHLRTGCRASFSCGKGTRPSRRFVPRWPRQKTIPRKRSNCWAPQVDEETSTPALARQDRNGHWQDSIVDIAARPLGAPSSIFLDLTLIGLRHAGQSAPNERFLLQQGFQSQDKSLRPASPYHRHHHWKPHVLFHPSLTATDRRLHPATRYVLRSSKDSSAGTSRTRDDLNRINMTRPPTGDPFDVTSLPDLRASQFMSDAQMTHMTQTTRMTRHDKNEK